MSRTTLDDIVAHCDSWDESKHPRSEDGKFGSGGGSSDPDDDLVTVTPASEERGHSIPAPPKGAISPEKERAWHEAKKAGGRFVGDSGKKLDSIVAACDSYDGGCGDCSGMRADESKFAKLEGKLAHRKGVTNPRALAASIGIKKLGAHEMAERSAAARKR